MTAAAVAILPVAALAVRPKPEIEMQIGQIDSFVFIESDPGETVGFSQAHNRDVWGDGIVPRHRLTKAQLRVGL